MLPVITVARFDQDFTDFIKTARQKCETVLRRGLLTQTWQLSLKNWPGRDYQNWPLSLTSELDLYYKYNYIKLPLAAPLQSVGGVNYMNSNGQNLSMTPANFLPNVSNGYNVITTTDPGMIVLPYSQIWPTDILMPGAPITIPYTLGYADAAAFAQNCEFAGAVYHAMKLMVTYWYENKIPPSEIRKSQEPAGIDLVINDLLNEYRVYD